jgi:hypothetical protein
MLHQLVHWVRFAVLARQSQTYQVAGIDGHLQLLTRGSALELQLGTCVHSTTYLLT